MVALGLAAVGGAAGRGLRPRASAGRRTRSTTSTWPLAGSSGWRPAPASSCSARSWGPCSSASSSCRTCWGTRRSRPAWPSSRPSCCMVLVAPRSAKLVEVRGARFTLLLGYVFCLLGFVTMLAPVERRRPPTGRSGWPTPSSASGVGFAGTPASHSLTSSVPVTRAGMASGTADLQRDLGGAIMQSILGALLTAGYASRGGQADRRCPRLDQAKITDSVQTSAREVVLQRRGHRAAVPAVRRPDHRRGPESFVAGQRWAYTAGIVAILLGGALVFFIFPKRDDEQRSWPSTPRGRRRGLTARPAQAPAWPRVDG